MKNFIALTATAISLAVPALALADPNPWVDQNKADATICSTYGRDGTQAVVKPQPGVDSSCVKPGGGSNGDGVAPTGSVTSPTDGSDFSVGQVVTAGFSCADDHAIAACSGWQCPEINGAVDPSTCVQIADGGALDTSTAGSYVFDVHATDTSGNVSDASTHFTVTAGTSGGGNAGSDRDGDGVLDANDACPDVAAATADGCPADGSGSGSGSNDGSGANTGSGVDGSSNGTGGTDGSTDGTDGSTDGTGANTGTGGNDGSTSSTGGTGGSTNVTGSGTGTGTGKGATGSDANGAPTADAALGEQLVLGARLAGCNIKLTVSHKQRSLRKKGLILRVRADRSCTVKMSGRLIPAKKAGARKAKARTSALTLKLKAGKAQTVNLRFTKKGLAYIKRSLKGKVTRARIFVSDGGDVGHKVNRSFTIRIKR